MESQRGIGSTKIGGPSLKAVDLGKLDHNPTINVETFQKADLLTRTYTRTSLTNSGPYMFHVPPIPHHVIDMSNIKKFIKCRILKSNNETINDKDDPKTEIVVPVSLFGSAFINNVQLQLNGMTFPAESGIHCNTKAYIEAMINPTKTSRISTLQPQFYFPENSGKLDQLTLGGGNKATQQK